MDGADESRSSLYRVLLDRFRGLEASHQKLNEQFEVLLQERARDKNVTFQCRDLITDSGNLSELPGWASIPGAFFVESPYRRVLEYMGHAVHVNRIASGEIIYWNPAAEKLFGYKAYEVVGRRVSELRIEEEHHLSTQEIVQKLAFRRSLSGQVPLKKKSGQIFMGMVTKTPFYEAGEFAGIVTVSSDAAIFNNTNSGNTKNDQDHGVDQSNNRRINLKKIQWQPQPRIAAIPHISTSVSKLASKVLSLKRGDATSGPACRATTENEEAEAESHDVRADKPPRAPAVKFSNSQVGAANNLQKVMDENIQQNGSDHNFRRKDATCEASYRKDLTKSMHDICYFDAMSHLEDPLIGNPSGKFKNYSDVHLNPSDTNKSCFSGAFAGAYQGPFDGNRFSDWLSKSSFQQDGKESRAEDASPRKSGSLKIPSSGENVGSGPESSPSRTDNDAHMVENSEIRWEDLQLREEIGQGSFAIVYRGVWNGSDVAVKVYFGNQYTEKTLLDYKKEIDIMRRLRHPNVLLFMGAVSTEEKLAMVTEYLTRGSLFKTLHKNNQSLDIRRRLKMAIDVARGMNYLHHRNPPIVHRDLKSSNLLVDKSWTVKVGDFGLSKLKDATFLTAKSGRGTPQWMAPEVLRNEPSTEKSDVFSFGVILWELMTESIPWSNLNSLQVVGVVGFMNRRLDLPENIDPQISSIISDCWRSNPEDRPSFEDIIHRMTDLVHTGAGVAARTASGP